MILPWGKYAGEDLGDVPDGYLNWLFDNMVIRNKRDRQIHAAVTKELAERDETGFSVPDDYENFNYR